MIFEEVLNEAQIEVVKKLIREVTLPKDIKMNDLTCPKCKTSLKMTRIAAGLLWMCGTCSGAAVNSAVLRRYLKNETVNELWRTAVTQSTPSRRLCPSCRQALRIFATSLDERRISLDLCKACQLMWFDTNELEAFPKAPKVQPAEMERNLELAKVQFEANMVDRESPAENIVAKILEIIILIIRLLLFR